jgi:hypothetical protein
MPEEKRTGNAKRQISEMGHIALILGGSALSGLCHGLTKVNLAPAFFFPVFLMMAMQRRLAFLSAFAFYLLASIGVAKGAPVFFGVAERPVALGLFFWLGTAFALSLPWVLLWQRKRMSFLSKTFALLLVLLLVTLPPIGLWGWANPLLCAGYLLPATKEMGIIAVLLLWAVLWEASERRKNLFFALMIFVAGYIAYMSPSKRLDAKTSQEWDGIYTSFGKLYSGSDDTLGAVERQAELSKILNMSNSKYVVLPETVAGWWGKIAENLWNDDTQKYKDEGRTYFVGAEIGEKGTSRYFNVVQIRGANSGTIAQRFPVPISMWRPFSKAGAIANWHGGNGMISIDGQKVGVLICYEPYLYLPSFVTMLNRPDIIIAVSNSWWCRDTNLPLISDKSVKSWGLLFDVPVLISKNI